MAIAFDAASSASGSAITSLTWSHTCTGTNLLLMVGTSFYDGSQRAISGVTYAGVAMTKSGERLTGSGESISIWSLVNPATGANNIVATVAAGGTLSVVGGGASFTGVDQTTPLGTVALNDLISTTPSVSVTSATNELVIDTLGAAGGSVATVDAAQTQRWNLGVGTIKGAGSTKPGAATVTMNWTLDSSVKWAIGGISIKPSTAGPVALAGSIGCLSVAAPNNAIVSWSLGSTNAALSTLTAAALGAISLIHSNTALAAVTSAAGLALPLAETQAMLSSMTAGPLAGGFTPLSVSIAAQGLA